MSMPLMNVKPWQKKKKYTMTLCHYLFNKNEAKMQDCVTTLYTPSLLPLELEYM